MRVINRLFLSAISLSLALLLSGCFEVENSDQGLKLPTEPWVPGEVEASTGEEGGSTGEDWLDDGSSGTGDFVPGFCNKIDFLFVIDSSGSMMDKQQKLVQSFPKFFEAIQRTTNDYHIMVVDSGQLNRTCTESCQTNPLPPEECQLSEDHPDVCDPGKAECPLGACGDWNTCYIDSHFSCRDPASQCMDLTGSGITYSKTNHVNCNFSSGGRYIDASQENPAEAFSCAALVGTRGDADEKMMESMLRAVAPKVGDEDLLAKQCNQGFLRDDALLVITLITDEDDGGTLGGNSGSKGDPTEWAQNLLAARGLEIDEQKARNSVVTLGIFDQGDGDCGYLSASNSGDRIKAFLDLMDHSVYGSVCDESYESFFVEAANKLSQTCSIFVP